MFKKIDIKLKQLCSITPLVSFRILFGFMMFVSILRFMLNGWVADLYIKPQFYFSYYGFDWVKPLGELGMYLIFVLMALSTLGIALGFLYRYSSLLFFLCFTYIELLDKSNYLNHYYFVSIISFLLIFLPAHASFSLDVYNGRVKELKQIPFLFIGIIQLQLALVYFFAGIAKLNTAWLFEAMPLKIWLPANSHLPLIGTLLNFEATAYLFSWFGAIYDLCIVFFLINKKTRGFAYFFVIVFHVSTRILFQIGMFPYIMIIATLIFFSESFHTKFVETLRSVLKSIGFNKLCEVPEQTENSKPKFNYSLLKYALLFFFLIQVLMPFRYLVYPGNLFWTEQGYRFSWRVMLMEKAGTAFFYVKDRQSGKEVEVMNSDFLTRNQEKMMATQADMILQYAHYLKKEYEKLGFVDPSVRVESYVRLNGNASRLLIDPRIDLTTKKESFLPKDWIL